MESQNKLVVFWLDEQRFALHLSNIERIIRIVEITPLPKSPEYIMGIINFHGEFLPVVNVRKIFALPEKEIDLNDQLIVVDTSLKKVALWVDSVSDIVERSDEEIIEADKILMDIEYVEGLFKLEDGMVIIHDLEKFLQLEQIPLLKGASSNIKSEGSESGNNKKVEKPQERKRKKKIVSNILSK